MHFIKDIMNRWWKIRSGLSPDSYCEIALESLISDKESILRYLCEFLQLDWDNSLMKTDMSNSHSGRWKKDLSRDQLNQVCSVLDEHLSKMGYA